ncbi:hypothetical protein [Allorhizocola rhizosphaerae]|uniref:hypothetical protein n=1 Tax=Allorhizocola rhizosphaerae TaxID=1872709 RepID=UPI000E3E0BA6|nr:hypothetical protein [Allorhizocola rhizosphaerae]
MTNAKSEADRELEKEERRDGGPSETPGMMTTTGGKAGTSMRVKPGRKNPGKTAPTTTGDAGSGGMNPPTSGTTSSNSSGG